VSAISKLGSEEATAVLAPEFLALVPGFFSSDAEESVRSLDSLLRMCFAREPSAAELHLMLGYNVSVPPFVRQALFSRAFDNDDLLPTLRSPVLITHGADDAIVSTDVVERHRALVPHAQVDIMPGAGHAPFWDDSVRFNQRLAAFCDEVSRGEVALDRRESLSV
jgi:pimeloyl-ACP methyl ester carboxylesterase